MNVISYINKYQNVSFKQEKLNEIDNMIFSNLVYLNFKGIVSSKDRKTTLEDVGNIFFKKYKKRDMIKLGVGQLDAYEILEKIYKSKRYKNIFLSNYKYIGNLDQQFGAICFSYTKNNIYVAYQGTDNLLSGWFENFSSSYLKMNNCQKSAIKYLNRFIKNQVKTIIIGGHSKGGNLALISAMYSNRIINKKIIKIYSNDGYGVNKEQYNSVKYKRIKNRYYHFAPQNTLVSLFMYSDLIVIKSFKIDFICHDMKTWLVNDKNLMITELSEKSKNIKNKLDDWVNNTSKEEKKKSVEFYFNILKENEIYSLNDFYSLKKSIRLLNSINNNDNLKKLLINFFELKYDNMLNKYDLFK